MKKEVGFLDIRIEKTERAIKQAFMEQRAHKPLEKIRVKDLCEQACINKSTFYAHYQDIYALSNAIETELIEAILADLPELTDTDLRGRTDWLTSELFRAFMQNKDAVQLLFSGSRQGIFANRIETALRERFSAMDPTLFEDPARGIILSFCVQGCYYAFINNSALMDEQRLVALLAAIARAAHNIDI